MPFRLIPEYHSKIYLCGLLLMAIGLPFSKVIMSISQFILVGNWLWEGDLKNKVKAFWHNKAAVLLASLPLLYLVGIIYSSDIDYALNDFRIKLPLLVLPLVVSTTAPPGQGRFSLIMNIFSLAIVVSSLVSVAAYFGYSPRQINNLRDISVFGSHIRFALMICIAVLFLAYSVFFNHGGNILRAVQLIAAAWLIGFLFFMESATGLTILFVTSLVLGLIYSMRQRSFVVKLFFSGMVLLIPSLLLVLLFKEIKAFYRVKTTDIASLEKNTPYGEAYVHDTTRMNFENGNLVWIYYAPAELEREWNSRSAIKYNEKDQRGQDIGYTLMRFLTSKNLRKDADGVRALTAEEVKAIERGDANVLYLEKGIRKRFHQILWEFNNYFNGENPQGNSITQRIEFWKAAGQAIMENPFFGAGTGELQHEMNRQYAKINTQLEAKYWFKPHNQFVTITVTFGIFGLGWFLCFLFAPASINKRWGEFFYTSFFIVAVLSMLSEDTLDTQAGITFFTFFSCLFLFRD